MKSSLSPKNKLLRYTSLSNQAASKSRSRAREIVPLINHPVTALGKQLDENDEKRANMKQNFNSHFYEKEGFNIGMNPKTQNNVLSSLCGLPKAFQGRKLTPIAPTNNHQDHNKLSTRKTSLNPLRKLEAMSHNSSNFSLFNDPSDTEVKKKVSPKVDSNQNILKLAEDTLNFIDQELTKSYKLSNINSKTNNTPTKEHENLKKKDDCLKSIGK